MTDVKKCIENPIEEMSFESAMQELEEISLHLQKPDVILTDMVKMYKRASELHNYCNKILAEAKLQINVISENGSTENIDINNIKRA